MEQDQLKAYWIERLRSEYRADPTGQATAFSYKPHKTTNKPDKSRQEKPLR